MLAFYNINLAAIVQPAAFDAPNNYLTVQVDYNNIDGDFEVVPKQSLDEINFDPIYDFKNQPITFRIRKLGTNKYTSGTKTFNIDASLYSNKIKLVVSAIAGKFAATAGTVSLRILNSDTFTTTVVPTTTAAPTTTVAATTTA